MQHIRNGDEDGAITDDGAPTTGKERADIDSGASAGMILTRLQRSMSARAPLRRNLSGAAALNC